MANATTAIDTTAPVAVSWEPTTHWRGNDGEWNMFEIRVGTPPQTFLITPAISQYEAWVPDARSCDVRFPDHPGDCGELRGTETPAGVESGGFNRTLSRSWQDIGIWTLNLQETRMGYGTNANYGNDTVTLGDGSHGLSLPEQVVGSVADTRYWMGQFGLQPKSDNFSEIVDPVPSYMTSLVKKAVIPSETWGYTAGAIYRGTQASLTLGGYDANMMQGDSISMGLYDDDGRPFMVGLRSIFATDTLKGPMNLLPTATYAFIDSTFPWLWLPDDTVAKFVDNLGLTFDESTEMYTINETVHDQLVKLNPSFTFTISESKEDDSSKAINITLPYAAFDLNASYPIYDTPTRYFPIRKGVDQDQVAIGRAFLQEAYLIADFPRQNFTLSQIPTHNVTEKKLVTIQRPADNEVPIVRTMNPPSGGVRGLSGTAIAGIVVGIVALSALLILGLVFCLIRCRKQRRADDVRAHLDSRQQEEPKELSSEGTQILEGPSAARGTEKFRMELETPTSPVEMAALPARHELASPMAELAGDSPQEKAWPIQ